MRVGRCCLWWTAGALLGLAALALRADEPTAAPADDEPMPMQRVRIDPERLAPLLEKQRQGVLVQVPRGTFEEQVRQAARGRNAQKSPPRLVEARYRASLADDTLTGSADWKVANPSGRQGLLPLGPLYLALRKARWTDGSADAWLGAFAGRPAAGPELLVGPAESRTVALEWSARGLSEPGGLRFALRLPACPVATLDLDLPANLTPSVGSGALASQTGASGPRRTWRIAFGSSPQLDLTLRRPAGPGRPAPLVRSHLETRQEVFPDEARCRYQFDLEVFHGSPTELTLDCDAPFRPTEVTAADLDGWESHPGPAGDAPTRLVIRFRSPLSGGTVQVAGVAPLSATADALWTSPGVRVVGGVRAGESLALRVHPDLRIRDWQPGGFRLGEATVGADGWQAVTLRSSQGTGPDAKAVARRPQFRPHRIGPSFDVQQANDWYVGTDYATLTARLRYAVRRGSPFQVQLRVPTDWQVERVDLTPAGRLQGWSPVPGPPGLLAVDLRPGPAAEPLELTVRLRAAGRPQVWPVPDVFPVGASRREGRLAVRVAHALRATPPTDALPPPVGPPSPDAAEPPDFTFDLGAEAPQRTLQVRLRIPDLQTRCRTDVRVRGRTIEIVSAVTAEADTPAATALLLFATTPDAPSDWQVVEGTNEVRGVDRLDANRGARLFKALARWAAPALGRWLDGTWWRVRLARPVEGVLRLEAHRELADVAPPDPAVARQLALAGLGGRSPWELTALAAGRLAWPRSLAIPWRPVVPLVAVVGAGGHPSPGVVTIEHAAGDPVLPETVGLAEQADSRSRPDGRAGPVFDRREFRYVAWPPRLGLREAAPRRPEEGLHIELASLTADATTVDRVRVRFRCQVGPRPPRLLPVRLPPGAVPLSAAIAGHAITQPARLADGILVWDLPLPATLGWQSVEVWYELERPAWRHFAALHAPAPELPVPLPGLRRVWCLPPGVVPLNARGLHAPPDGAGPTSDNDSTSLTDLAALDPSDDETPPAPPASADAAELRFPLPPGSTVWEVDPGQGAGDGLTVLRSASATVAGLVPAGVFLALAGWLFARRVPGRWALTAGALLAAGLAGLWLPGPLRELARTPAFVLLLVLLLTVLRDTIHRIRPLLAGVWPVARASSATAAVLAVALVAAGATPRTLVYLVPGPADAPDKETVLVPPDLLKQLQALARVGQPSASAVLLGADYEGRANDLTATVKAQFQVYCAGERATLTLPLGAAIAEATLDGGPAFARAGPGAGVYTLEVRGPGPHVLSVQGTVPVTGTGDDRDVRLTVPELPLSRLAFEMPAGAREAWTVQARGSQRVAPGADRRVRLEAELGTVGLLHVRWRQEGGTPQPPRVRVQESACLWDIDEGSARLLASFLFRVTQGSTPRLELDVPADLEVASVTVRPRLPTVSAGPPPLKDWRRAPVGDGQMTRLSLELQGPRRGTWQVLLELIPRQSLTDRSPLRFPVPVGPADADQYAAFRVRGLDASGVAAHGLTAVREEWFLRQAWQPAEVERDARSPTRAFQCVRNARPSLQMTLRPPASDLRGTQTLSWHLGPGRADLTAEAHWTAPAGEPAISLIEWQVPAALTIAEVRGEGLHGWSRQGDLLQAWLTRPMRETVLRLTGSVRPVGGNADAEVFELVALRLSGVAAPATVLRIAADTGWAVAVENGFGLRPLDRPPPAAGELVYEADRAAYRARVRLHPPSDTSDYRLRTRAELDGGTVRFVSTIDLPARREGRPAPFVVTLSDADGADVRLHLPRGLKAKALAAGPDRRSWVVTGSPPPSGSTRLTLTGRMPLGAGGKRWLPAVGVATTDGKPLPAGQWVAVAGPPPRVRETVGLTPVPAGPDDWPEARGRSTAVWKGAAAWRVRLATDPVGGEGVRVELADVRAAIEGGRWLHRVDYAVRHAAGARLAVRVPDAARILSAVVDRTEVSPDALAAGRLTVPLSEGAGVRKVGLVWAYAADREPFDRPLLEPPTLETPTGPVSAGPALYTLAIPPGFRTAAEAERVSPAAADLYRAEAQARLLRWLAESPPETASRLEEAQLAAARLARYCRRAEGRLAEDGKGPTGRPPLADWVRQLREVAPGAGEADEAGSPLDRLVPDIDPTRGPLACWYRDASTSAPDVRLVPVVRASAATLGRSLLLGLLVGGLVWLRPGGGLAGWAVRLAALGGIGWAALGDWLGPPFLLLAVFGLAAWLPERVAAWLFRRHQRAAAPPEGG